MKQVYQSFWLMPCQQDRKILQALIDDLSARHNTPRFPPHLTIHVSPMASDKQAGEVLESLRSQQVPIKLAVKRLDISSSYTMTFFIRCRKKPELQALHEVIRKRSPASQYQLDPHISLLYADLALERKQALVRELPAPLEKVWFDRIRAVKHPWPVESQEDITAFEDLAELVFQQHP